MLDAHSQIVSTRDAFVLHASEAPTNPFVQLVELAMAIGEARSKIIRRPAYHSVEFHHDLLVQVMVADGKFPDFVSKFLHGPWADTHEPGRDTKPQEFKSFSCGRDLRLFPVELQAQLVREEIVHHGQCLFRLGSGFDQHHEVIGIPYETVSVLIEVPVEPVEDDVSQKGTDDPSLWRPFSRRDKLTVLHDA